MLVGLAEVLKGHFKKDFNKIPLSYIVIAFLLYTSLSSFSINHFYISIDDEIFAFNNPYKNWISMDRWVAGLISLFLFTNPTLPFLPAIFFGVCILITFWVLAISYNIEKDYLFFIYFLVFTINPIWFFIVIFDGIIPSVGIGLVFSSLSAYLFKVRDEVEEYKIVIIILSAIFLCIAIGAYQSLLIFTIVSFASISFIKFINNRNYKLILLNFLFALIIVIIALALHLLISQLFKNIYNIETSEYILGFIKLSNINSFTKIFDLLLYEPLRFYSGSEVKYGISLVSIPILICALLLHILMDIKNNGLSFTAISIFIVFSILSSPFMLNTLGDAMPSRSLFPIASALLTIFVLLIKLKFNKLIFMLLAIFFLFQSVTANS